MQQNFFTNKQGWRVVLIETNLPEIGRALRGSKEVPVARHVVQMFLVSTFAKQSHSLIKLSKRNRVSPQDRGSNAEVNEISLTLSHCTHSRPVSFSLSDFFLTTTPYFSCLGSGPFIFKEKGL